MSVLLTKVDKRVASSELAIVAEAHTIGEDTPFYVFLKEAPLSELISTVTIAGFTEVTTSNPAASSFYVHYSGRWMGAIQFNAADDGTVISVNYKGRGSTLFARDINNIQTEKVSRDGSIPFTGSVGLGTAIDPGTNGSGLAIFDTNFPRLAFRNTTTGDTVSDGLQMYMVGLDFFFDLAEQGRLIFQTSSVERMTILKDGKIGIGTATPLSNLHIKVAGQSHLRFENSSAGGGTVVLATGDTGSNDGQFTFNHDGGGILNAIGIAANADTYFNSGGNLGIGATVLSAKTHIDQSSATGAIPVLYLDQADVSEEMIEFNTTIGTGNAIEAVGAKTLTTTHFIKVTLPGSLTRYIPCGTIA